MIETEKIGSFNPFNNKWFKCPVCGSNSFVELQPYGGVWCKQCNAMFTVQSTCDGVNKLAVRCETTHVWNPNNYPDMAEVYGAIVWSDDQEVSWLRLKERTKP